MTARPIRDSPVKRAIVERVSVSGEDLAREFRISRVAVWKHVEELRRLGYRIESGRRGYVLLDKPDLPYPWEFGVKSVYLLETDSTMNVAWSMKDWTFVIAGKQRAGRGRRGRRWFSPPGGLYFSMIFSPKMPLTSTGELSEVVLGSIKEYLGNLGIEVSSKENGLYIDGKKLGGVLVEAMGELDEVKKAVVGVGLNVRNPVPERGISLAMVLNDVSLLDVARRLLPLVEESLRRFLR